MVTITCTASDGLSGVNGAASTVVVTKPNSIVVSSSCGASFSDTTEGGTYTATYTVVDHAGNSASVSGTFIANDAGGSSSSSSSSGGGGSSSSAAAQAAATETKTVLIDQFVPEKTNTFKVVSDTVAVDQIDVEVTNKVSNVEIKVVRTIAAPKNVAPPVIEESAVPVQATEPSTEAGATQPSAPAASSSSSTSGNIYQYLEIIHDKVSNDNIKSAKMKFAVTKKWISEKSVEKKNIVLKRYDSGVWTSMKTLLLSETSTEILFEAELPGLSVFAIVEEKPVQLQVQPTPQPEQPVQQEQPKVQPVAESKPYAPVSSYPMDDVYGIVGAIAVLLLLGFVWHKMSKRPKSPSNYEKMPDVDRHKKKKHR